VGKRNAVEPVDPWAKVGAGHSLKDSGGQLLSGGDEDEDLALAIAMSMSATPHSTSSSSSSSAASPRLSLPAEPAEGEDCARVQVANKKTAMFLLFIT